MADLKFDKELLLSVLLSMFLRIILAGFPLTTAPAGILLPTTLPSSTITPSLIIRPYIMELRYDGLYIRNRPV